MLLLQLPMIGLLRLMHIPIMWRMWITWSIVGLWAATCTAI